MALYDKYFGNENKAFYGRLLQHFKCVGTRSLMVDPVDEKEIGKKRVRERERAQMKTPLYVNGLWVKLFV